MKSMPFPYEQNRDEINLHRLLAVTQTLGPYKRCAIWFQGCPKNCPGCMTPDSRPWEGGRKVATRDLLERARSLLPDIDGVTISGGEPFLQYEALACLTEGLQKLGLGVILYTGYYLSELKELQNPHIDAALRHTDILIDGPYREELDDGKALRGSANQAVHQLSGRYQAVFEEYYERNARTSEVILGNREVFLCGIPDKHTLDYIDRV